MRPLQALRSSGHVRDPKRSKFGQGFQPDSRVPWTWSRSVFMCICFPCQRFCCHSNRWKDSETVQTQVSVEGGLLWQKFFCDFSKLWVNPSLHCSSFIYDSTILCWMFIFFLFFKKNKTKKKQFSRSSCFVCNISTVGDESPPLKNIMKVGRCQNFYPDNWDRKDKQRRK